jgi:hypothetical protein
VQCTSLLSLDDARGTAFGTDEQASDCKHGSDLNVRGEEGFSSTADKCVGVAAATSRNESLPSSSPEPSSRPAPRGGADEASSSQAAPAASRTRSRRRAREDDELSLPSSRRTLTLADLPRNWNGQRKAWFEEALQLREQLLRGVYLDARQRMRIQESLFGAKARGYSSRTITPRTSSSSGIACW